jgi:hypothetical protein
MHNKAVLSKAGRGDQVTISEIKHWCLVVIYYQELLQLFFFEIIISKCVLRVLISYNHIMMC